ncbi:MAG: excinuclease ABC subunit UvrA [Acidobacteriota bacterium]
MEAKEIVIKGAAEHNLKHIDLTIPRNKLVVITGVSGSGKSSLAFDTLYAEGQRRYVESLSAYARQFLEQMEKPNVEFIEGLSPAISIEQKSASRNPRSTVATITEIYDYLRLLFARIGKPHCHKCEKPIAARTVQQIVDSILSFDEGTKVQILSPIVRGRKGEYRKELAQAARKGFLRARIDGIIYDLSEEIILDKNKKHDIEIIVDRIVLKEGIKTRVTDSVEMALDLAGGLVIASIDKQEEILFSRLFSCVDCGVSVPELAPRMFSFNSPYGACQECSGLGVKRDIDPDKVVPNKYLSIADGAIDCWNKPEGGYYRTMLKTVLDHYRVSEYTPFYKIPGEIQKILLHGSGEREFDYEYEGYRSRYEFRRSFEGVIPNLERRYRETQSEEVREDIEMYMSSHPCPSCRGARLRPESLAVKISGKNIAEHTALSIKDALEAFDRLDLDKQQMLIAQQVLKEIKERLGFMMDVGLGYLTLDRTAATLAGGEAQRIRLATQIGSRLTGVLYILDEPSIGLHQRDNRRLLNTLLKMRDLGNTVIVVEHDEETIRTADFVVDLGPGAGEMGGEVVVTGTPEDIMKCENSLTGKYISGRLKIDIPEKRRKDNGAFLTIEGAAEHNLKKINVNFPLGLFIAVTGVSGSGKSTLIIDILYRALVKELWQAADSPGKYRRIRGLEYIDKVINIEQSPIGRTPRSNPATYVGLFTPIRELFSMVQESKMRGYKPGRFSFNVRGGRCEACQGDGLIRIEMHFLPDVYVTCESCKGRRYNRETLEIVFKGATIADVLDMTVQQALEFFKNIPKIRNKLQTLYDVGLGYIKLGQSATTLSGGEAQRVKLAKELSKRATGKTLYVLDEPTTGLHFDDIKKLLNVLNRLTDAGNTVIVIEHNLDVIKTADWIIDLGPEGGDEGGEIIAQGTPEQIARNSRSYTGQFLKKILSL